MTTALALRLIWLFAVPSTPYTDYAVYDGLAQNIAAGKGFIDDFSPSTLDDAGKLAWRPPGLPYLLAAAYRVFGDNLNIGKMVILLFSMGVVVMTYPLSKAIFGETTGRIAALIVACFPSLIAYTSVLGTEMPFTFFLLLALLLLIRPQPRLYTLLIAGALLGITALIRPTILAFIAILPIYFHLRSRSIPQNFLRSLIKTIPVGVAMLLVILPWTLRNYTVLGSFVLVTSNSGTVLWEGTQTTAAGDAVLGVLPLCEGLGEVECDHTRQAAAISNIRADPVAYLRYGAIKLARLYAFDYEAPIQATTSTSDGWAFSDGLRFLLIASTEVYYLIIVALMLAGSIFAALRRVWKPEYSLYWLFFLLWSAIYFIFQGESRYHLPLLPLFVGFAALALTAYLMTAAQSSAAVEQKP